MTSILTFGCLPGRAEQRWNAEQALPNSNTSQVTAADACGPAHRALPEGRF